MASNKVATVVLLDVGSSMSNVYDSTETFFEKCRWCLLRIIQRTIFSGENDELAVVLFGCEETNNNLALSSPNGMYENISEFTRLQIPNWDIYEKIVKLKPTEINNSNWLEGLVIGLDYLKEQTRGKRFKDKQILILSNFAVKLKDDDDKISRIASDGLNTNNIKLIVIGVDLDQERENKVMGSQLPGSIELISSLIDQIENGISLSFDETEEDIIYYERKKKMGRFSKVNLTIGSKISIPIRWIKLNLEPTRIKWALKPSTKSRLTHDDSSLEISYIMDTQKNTTFGNSEVVLGYADLEAMKRQSGPPSCTLLGCVKRQRINIKLFVGSDIYFVAPERTPRAQAMLSAFIDALIESDRFALIRRVAVKNGKVKLGVFVPVAHDDGKMLYFLQLPFAEHAMVVPHVIMPEPSNTEILLTIDNLIDTMTIPVEPKNLPMKDPSFQLRCHILNLYQSGQCNEESEQPKTPEFINKLTNPYPELLENAMEHIEKLRELLPIVIPKKVLEAENDFDLIMNPSTASKSDETNDEKPNHVKEDMDWVNAETQEWF